MKDPGPLARTLTRLSESGYHVSLRVSNGKVVELGSGLTHDPEELHVDEMIRFDCDTDPNEQALVFALSDADGKPLGTYTVAYGPETPPEDAAIVTRLNP